jgi:NAD(P)-dependent dehydrogenase (short-subunit alcohol dehydrogenase family)
MSRLTGKTAIVTGASKGIGAGIAKSLAAEGARVVVNYATSREGADRIVSEISKNGGKAVAIQADVSKPDEVQQLFRESREAFGTLDVLVNNAGVAPKERRDILDATEESFDDVMSVNLKGIYFLMQRAANWMIDQRKNDNGFKGCIVNISSISATVFLLIIRTFARKVISR